MSSPRERSEARRKALLTRGNDRLKKLTNSARGEDAPQFVHDDPPLAVPSVPLRSFLGESTPDSAPTPTPPSARSWSPEQLRRAMDTLTAHANTPPPEPISQSLPFDQIAPGITAGTKPLILRRAHSKRLSRAFSLTTLLLPLAAAFYFATFYEPSIYQSYAHVRNDHWTARWARLGVRASDRVVDSVYPVPLFSTLLSFQLAQQVLNAFFIPATDGLPPTFTMLTTHLPVNLQRWISQLLFCLRLFFALLDQISVAVFCVGLIVWIAAGIGS